MKQFQSSILHVSEEIRGKEGRRNTEACSTSVASHVPSGVLDFTRIKGKKITSELPSCQHRKELIITQSKGVRKH